MYNESINPYQLLGLNSNSTLNELRKSYYELSKLCHPDRGGNNEEMYMLHKSYLYVKQELENCKDKSIKDYNYIINEFETFCNQQDIEKLDTFYNIYLNMNDFMKDFNKKFEELKKEELNINKGYGDLMVQSNIINYNKQNLDDMINQYANIDETQKQLKSDFKSDIIIYKEPAFLPNTYGNFQHLDNKEVKDFSETNHNFSFNDYKLAYSNYTKNLEDLIEDSRINRNYEDMISQRLLQDKMDIKNDINDGELILKKKLEHNNKCAILLQKHIRGYIIRINNYRIQYYKDIIEKDIHAIQIQKIIRRYIVLKECKKQKIEKEITEIENKIQQLKNKQRQLYFKLYFVYHIF